MHSREMGREKILANAELPRDRGLSSALPPSLPISLFPLLPCHATGSSIGTPLLGEQFLKPGEGSTTQLKMKFPWHGREYVFPAKDAEKCSALLARNRTARATRCTTAARTAIH